MKSKIGFFLIRERLAPPEPPWPACCGHIPVQLRFQKNAILVISPLSLPFPFSPSVSF